MHSALEHFKIFAIMASSGCVPPLTNLSLVLVTSLVCVLLLSLSYPSMTFNCHSFLMAKFLYLSWGVFYNSCFKLKGGTYILCTSVLLLILMFNILGLMPFSFSMTSQFIIPLGLSFSLWLGCSFLGLSFNKSLWFNHFMPMGSPIFLSPLLVGIEILSYFASSMSLGLSLAANIMSGHLLLNIISSFLLPLSIGSPFAILILSLLLSLEFSVALIQGYVFFLLLNIYLSDI